MGNNLNKCMKGEGGSVLEGSDVPEVYEIGLHPTSIETEEGGGGEENGGGDKHAALAGADDEKRPELAEELQQLLSQAKEETREGKVEMKQLNKEHQRKQQDLELFEKWKVSIRKLEKEGHLRMSLENKLALLSHDMDLLSSFCKGGRMVTQKMKEVDRLTRMVKKLEERKKSLPMLAVKEVELEDDGGKSTSTLPFLPVEIWTVILGNLTDPKDLWNCTNTCQLFNEILQEWKTTWMFQQALPHLFPHLPKQKVLECRLVSEGWNSVVEQFFEEHPSTKPYGSDASVDRRILPFVNPLREKDLDKVNYYSFTPESEASAGFPSKPGRRPFMGRDLTVNIELNSSDEDMSDGKLSNRQIWDNIFSFLATFGNEVWYFHVSATCGEEPTAQVQQKVFHFFLADLCTLIPNIRSLSMEIPREFAEDLMLRGEVLTRFPKLESLSTTFLPNIIGIFTPVKHNEQLKSLRVSADIWRFLGHFLWPKLTALHLELISDEQHFEALIQSKANIPQLGFLELNLFLDEHNRSNWEFDWIQRVINKLCSATKLKALRLNELTVPGDSLFRNLGDTFAIMPPSLTTLEFECNSVMMLEVPNFTFLVRFPFLENLHVFWSSTKPGERLWKARNAIGLVGESEYPNPELQLKFQQSKEMVDVNKYIFRKEMYESNIWELLPRLNIFTFQWDVYTRAGYEQFVAQKRMSEN